MTSCAWQPRCYARRSRSGRRPPHSLTLVETPWSLETNHDPQPLYQAVHRQYIKIALTTPECGISDYGNYPESARGMQLGQFVHEGVWHIWTGFDHMLFLLSLLLHYVP